MKETNKNVEKERIILEKNVDKLTSAVSASMYDLEEKIDNENKENDKEKELAIRKTDKLDLRYDEAFEHCMKLRKQMENFKTGKDEKEKLLSAKINELEEKMKTIINEKAEIENNSKKDVAKRNDAIKTLETEKEKASKEFRLLKERADKLESEVDAKNEEINHIKETHEVELNKTKDQNEHEKKKAFHKFVKAQVKNWQKLTEKRNQLDVTNPYDGNRRTKIQIRLKKESQFWETFIHYLCLSTQKLFALSCKERTKKPTLIQIYVDHSKKAFMTLKLLDGLPLKDICLSNFLSVESIELFKKCLISLESVFGYRLENVNNCLSKCFSDSKIDICNFKQIQENDEMNDKIYFNQLEIVLGGGFKSYGKFHDMKDLFVFMKNCK